MLMMDNSFLREDFHCCQECGTRFEKIDRLVQKLGRKLLKIYTVTFKNLDTNEVIDGDDVLGKLRRQIVTHFDRSPAFGEDLICGTHPPQLQGSESEFKVELDQGISGIGVYDVLPPIDQEISDVRLLQSDHADDPLTQKVPPTMTTTPPSPKGSGRISPKQPATKQRQGSKPSSMTPHPMAKLLCPQCGKEYANSDSLRVHRRLHSANPKPCKCYECGKAFSTKSILRTHIEVIHLMIKKVKNIPCPQCRKMFCRKSGMLEHLNNVHRKSLHPCSHCDKSFWNESSLRKHWKQIYSDVGGEMGLEGAAIKIPKAGDDDVNVVMDVEEGEFKIEINPYDVLPPIDEETGDDLLLQSDNEGDPVTEEAPSSTPSPPQRSGLISLKNQTAGIQRRALQIDLKMEEEDTQLTNLEPPTLQNSDFNGSETSSMTPHPTAKLLCYQCGKEYANSKSLRVHQRLHGANPKPFQCDECDKAFSQKPDLTKNGVHRGMKNFTCAECFKKFDRKGGMLEHLKSVHLNIRHPCDHCHISFMAKSSLRKHLKKAHPSELFHDLANDPPPRL